MDNSKNNPILDSSLSTWSCPHCNISNYDFNKLMTQFILQTLFRSPGMQEFVNNALSILNPKYHKGTNTQSLTK